MSDGRSTASTVGSCTRSRKRRNALIEGARDTEAKMLTQALSSKRIFAVEAPFPFNPAALHEALRPFCE